MSSEQTCMLANEATLDYHHVSAPPKVKK